uniref:Uncharacterized protein n=1 Tax=Arundo donax TaxID=35708 RepID=A0A0A9FRU3_ARUDO
MGSSSPSLTSSCRCEALQPSRDAPMPPQMSNVNVDLVSNTNDHEMRMKRRRER